MERKPLGFEDFEANDGHILTFQSSLDIYEPIPEFTGYTGAPYPHKLILLLHGFSGSSEYFYRNIDAISKGNVGSNSEGKDAYWVVAPDLRGHGRSARSARTKTGHHVARLAVDLHNLINHLRDKFEECRHGGTEDLEIIAVGCSIGAAIVWTYTELFTCSDFAGLVFVDQAPLQNALYFGENDPDNWDNTKHHKGCYNEATLQAAQRAWMLPDRRLTHLGLVNECLGYRQRRGPNFYPLPPGPGRDQDFDFFSNISQQCDGKWLARLMADHTQYDHREEIKKIDVPALVMAGAWSGCFTMDGMLETAKLIQAHGGDKMKGKVAVSVFENDGHWLFYENPERFNREIIEFADRWMK
ncbi:Alpha/Beta hydrolase fold [Naviculisporaceae sp. PSN 640]